MPSVDVSELTVQQLRKVAEVTGESISRLLDKSVKQLHRAWIGCEASEGGPVISTGPFRKIGSLRWAEVVVRQVDANTFRRIEPFRYWKNGVTEFELRDDGSSDFASIPPMLTWLVPRYGRHTFSALLHDHLQDVRLGVTPECADRLFRDSMGETGVPLVRRWLMWGAVALRTKFKHGGRALLIFAPVSAYFLAGLIGWPLLGVALLKGWITLKTAIAVTCIVVASPAVLSWPWGDDRRLVLLSGGALLILPFPTALICLVMGLYLAVEWIAEQTQPQPNPILARNLDNSTPQGNPDFD